MQLHRADPSDVLLYVATPFLSTDTPCKYLASMALGGGGHAFPDLFSLTVYECISDTALRWFRNEE